VRYEYRITLKYIYRYQTEKCMSNPVQRKINIQVVKKIKQK